MRGFLAVVLRDARLGLRAGGDAMTLVLFFVSVGAIVPFAVGPDRELLARIAPGIVWIAALLSMLLGLDRLFRADAEDGSLAVFRHAAVPMPAIVLAKMVAHWLTSALPLVVATPILALLLSMPGDVLLKTALSLACGTPALTALGAFGAAITVSLPRAGLIAPVVIMPLAIPVLILGVGAIAGPMEPDSALLVLISLSLVAVAFIPFAAALALRLADD